MNQKGHLIPMEQVSALDRLRDELVNKLLNDAEKVSTMMAEFKANAMSEVRSFIAVAAQDYDVEIGGTKGNTTLRTFDGQREISVRVADRMVFDERITVAKALIDECLHEWSEGSRSELKAVVSEAFNMDKEGKINTHSVLGLTRLSIDDPKWKRAMQAIKDSQSTASSQEYLRFYVRDDSGKRAMLNLDISTI